MKSFFFSEVMIDVFNFMLFLDLRDQNMGQNMSQNMSRFYSKRKVQKFQIIIRQRKSLTLLYLP